MANFRLFAQLGFCALILTVSCKPRRISQDSGTRGSATSSTQELPWEIINSQGATVLPDIFYAEPSENQQVMPLAVANDHVQIDRLIYPTIGNPALYLKNSPEDRFLVVLRIDKDLATDILVNSKKKVAGKDQEYIDLKQDSQNGIDFFLVTKQGRSRFTEPTYLVSGSSGERDVVRIVPTEVIENDTPRDMPDSFKERRTLRFSFAKEQMSGVPAGLYDIRFQIRKDGKLLRDSRQQSVYEYQYNALRVFDESPNELTSRYSIVNVTDTQYSVGLVFALKTAQKLTDFVGFINSTKDPVIRNAAFIVFAGDLHNGGSPGSITTPFVASNYNEEAKGILTALKELRLPIFLAPGNHDGYASIGQVPDLVAKAENISKLNLENTVADGRAGTWPNFSWNDYNDFLGETKDHPEGRHLDIFLGGHVRRSRAQTFRDGWLTVAPEKRNVMLYDGFYQWRKTYGPLNFAWTFGKTQFVSLNTFELRQHFRTGWGFFTVNYGGGMSPVQSEWANHEVERAERLGRDVVMIAHHDPRGGHKGKDYPYYFQQVSFSGVDVGVTDYIKGNVIGPGLCKAVPQWAQLDEMESDCLHDGLQEWMRADGEFDCDVEDRKEDGLCDIEKFDPRNTASGKKHPWYSGYALIDKITSHQNVRTLIMGHTHYNSIEVLQGGDEFVPGSVRLDQEANARYASFEIINPLRGFSEFLKHGFTKRTYDPSLLEENGFHESNNQFGLLLEKAGHDFVRDIRGKNRELVVLRVTSNADITKQVYNGSPMLGFAVYEVFSKSDKRANGLPQINRVSFYHNRGGDFAKIKTVDIDRTQKIGRESDNNPLKGVFTYKAL